jgi:hypothetical protein
MEAPQERDFGPQPLDGLLLELGLDNHDLVAASTEQLTHKQVQKARRGRYVTPNIRRKVLHALRSALAVRAEAAARATATTDGEEAAASAVPAPSLDELFTYRS